MPIITYEGGKVTKENKNELIRNLTKISSQITSVPETSFTVLIKENPIESWGVGGTPLEELMHGK